MLSLLGFGGKEPFGSLINVKVLLNSDENLIHHHSKFTTIVKHRYVEPFFEGKELSKLFSVNHIDKDHPSSNIEKDLYNKISSIIEDFDHSSCRFRTWSHVR